VKSGNVHVWIARLSIRLLIHSFAWEMAHVKVDSSLMRRIDAKKTHKCRNLAVTLRFIRNYATFNFNL